MEVLRDALAQVPERVLDEPALPEPVAA
jgi:hypothetical protein